MGGVGGDSFEANFNLQILLRQNESDLFTASIKPAVDGSLLRLRHLHGWAWMWHFGRLVTFPPAEKGSAQFARSGGELNESCPTS